MEKGSVREREGASIKRLSVSIKQASSVLFNIASFGPYKEKPPELNNSSIHYIHTMIESVVLVLVGEGDRVSMPLWWYLEPLETNLTTYKQQSHIISISQYTAREVCHILL